MTGRELDALNELARAQQIQMQRLNQVFAIETETRPKCGDTLRIIARIEDPGIPSYFPPGTFRRGVFPLRAPTARGQLSGIVRRILQGQTGLELVAVLDVVPVVAREALEAFRGHLGDDAAGGAEHQGIVRDLLAFRHQ